jgi:hypothetical protein
MASMRAFRTGLTRVASVGCAVRSPAHRSLGTTATKVAATGLDVVSPLIGTSDDQKEFYNLAKAFADNEMKPHAGI